MEPRGRGDVTVVSTEPPSIAVTGAAGYIGSRVARQVRSEHPGWELTLLDNFYRGTVREIDGEPVRHVDIRNRDRLEDALAGADVVMHLAAVSGVNDCEDHPDVAYEVNVQGTENVAWCCRKTGAGLVFPFSMAVLGNPQSFPIDADLPRDPLNWYGRTKLLGERSIEALADGAFPAHLFLKSNLYGEHEIDGRRITKGTVINFFVDRVSADEPLTVYEPGSQARNYLHVEDVADAYVRSTERLIEQLAHGETGATTYEIASDEVLSVMGVAELVRDVAAREIGTTPEIELVENPRSEETLVSDFSVDTSRARDELDWAAVRTVEETVRQLLRRRARSGDQTRSLTPGDTT